MCVFRVLHKPTGEGVNEDLHEEDCHGKCAVQEECRSLIGAAMARGNVALALSIYEAMCRAGPSGASAAQSGDGLGAVSWPHASLETVSAVVRMPSVL